MLIKGIVDEDFINYKRPSMFINFPNCSFKCDKECGSRVCQNSALAQAPNIKMRNEEIVKRYLNNKITNAIVFGGLEPFDSWTSLIRLIEAFRLKTKDDIIIYTGYTKKELNEALAYLTEIHNAKNIIIKFGRFIPNQQPHYDEVLGVMLASDNQYAERIS